MRQWGRSYFVPLLAADRIEILKLILLRFMESAGASRPGSHYFRVDVLSRYRPAHKCLRRCSLGNHWRA